MTNFNFKGGSKAMEDDNKCAHEACVCMVSGEEDYCSEHCEDAVDQDIIEISCDCGHSACK